MADTATTGQLHRFQTVWCRERWCVLCLNTVEFTEYVIAAFFEALNTNVQSPANCSLSIDVREVGSFRKNFDKVTLIDVGTGANLEKTGYDI